jgi:hypothetical protein
MKKKTYTGINIQYPISQLILSGEKTIETRTYPIPEKYLGQDMLMIETPGKTGKFKSRIVAIIRFDECFHYKNSKEFYKDTKRHCVTPDSAWAWTDEKPKWGWSLKIKKIKTSILCSKKIGIRYTTNLIIKTNNNHI